MTLDKVFETIAQEENHMFRLLNRCRESDKKVFLFGAGFCGHIYKIILEKYGFPIAGILDNFKTELEGVPVLRLQDAIKSHDLADCVFIISSPQFQAEIRQTLLQTVPEEQVYLFATTRAAGPNDPQATKDYLLGHKREISEIYELMSDDWSKKVMRHMLLGHVTGDFDCFEQVRTGDFYYPPDLIIFRPGEVMVELGSNDGETLLDFIARCPDFKRAYCFEPDRTCVRQLRQATENYAQRIQIIPKVAWCENGWIGFRQEGGSGDSRNSRVDAGEGAARMEAAAVDNEIPEPITYMKMDIEGSELAALRGAKNQIVQNKPRLAVSLYHKNEDILEIPQYILSLRPDYRLYMRHHGWDDADTVLYAV